MKTKNNTRRSPKRQRSQKKTKKRAYRIRNWKEYNASLVQRGSLTVWVEQAALDQWLNSQRSGGRGACHTYSDLAILTALSLKVVFRLPLRATQGLLTSVLRLLNLEHLPVPHYSTLCRRQKTLPVALPWQATGAALHVVVDATGCKIYGEGEWKVSGRCASTASVKGARHPVGRRKLHVAVDEATGQIVGAVLTTNEVADSAVLPELLEQVAEPIKQVSGDGGYDQRPCYDTLPKRQQEQAAPLRVTIPPRKGARIWQHGNSQAERLARDENLRRIRQVGRAQWKEESGYHRRSLAETTMFRAKTIFGDKLSARDFDRQAAQAFIGCAALNKMSGLGMPDSYAV